MSIHTVPSRDFARDLGTAKRLAADGPVFITDRNRPAFVLLKIDHYYELSGRKQMSLLELMDSMPGTAAVELDVPHADVTLRIPEHD